MVAVLPYFPYAKQRSEIDIPTKGPRRRSVSQERKVENHSSSTTDGIKYNPWPVQANTLISNLLIISGVDHFITMDLHDPQFQGFFDVPLENLPSLPLMAKCIKQNIPGWAEAVIVSPDAGGAKRYRIARFAPLSLILMAFRVAQLAEALDLNFALVHQDRRNSDAKILIGNVTNKLAILVDDLADTCDTLINAAEILHNQGAASIIAIITHGIFSGSAAANLEGSRIDRIYVSNTIPQFKTLQNSTKIHLFDVSCMFSEAIRRIHNGESVSCLFQPTAIH